MITSTEQRLIVWAARRHPELESLYGDLLEERSGGRSRVWFMRQLLYAQTAAVSRSMWAAKRTLAESWTLGCVTLLALLFAAYVTLLLGYVVIDLLRVTLLASDSQSARLLESVQFDRW